MQAIKYQDLTPEQLAILGQRIRPIEIIRGAAGSGKTTTAIYKMLYVINMMARERRSRGDFNCLDVLFLTYNKTLSGYVEFILEQMQNREAFSFCNLYVKTFAKWLYDLSGIMWNFEDQKIAKKIVALAISNFEGLDETFLCAELDYILEKYTESDIEQYIDKIRYGRGNPQLNKKTRREILDLVVYPYINKKRNNKISDWSDLTNWGLQNVVPSYDIIVVDEGQDFTVNRLKTIKNAVKEPGCLICVMDSVQQIYPVGFSWAECGIDARRYPAYTLIKNFRNTKRISRLAKAILGGISFDENGTLPDEDRCSEEGQIPLLLEGRFRHQMAHIIHHIQSIDLSKDSVAIFHKFGWFNQHIIPALESNNLPYYLITRENILPKNSNYIILSTMHSAKGLEFDHVFMPGLSNVAFPDSPPSSEDAYIRDRKLLAMAISRARKTVTLGQKTGEESSIINVLDSNFISRVKV